MDSVKSQGKTYQVKTCQGKTLWIAYASIDCQLVSAVGRTKEKAIASLQKRIDYASSQSQTRPSCQP